MNRRAVVTTIAGSIALSGCLSEVGDTQDTNPSGGSTTASTTNEPSTAPPTTLSTSDETPTPVTYTTDQVAATFQVVDSHTPTEDTASATFDGTEVTVTGTMDPSNCNRPALTDVRYNTMDAVLHVSVGGEARFGETATVECGNASYDYRCTFTVDDGSPEAVELVYAYEGKDNRSFNLVREE